MKIRPQNDKKDEAEGGFNMSITLNYEDVLGFINNEEIFSSAEKIKELNLKLDKGTGKGHDFLGWLYLPKNIIEDEISEIEGIAKEIRENSDLLVCVGIGGSYLGAKAVIHALSDNSFEIQFAGKNISGYELELLLKKLENKDFYINVISKSGTTTEPAIAFRFLKELAKKKYGKNYTKHIIATTDEKKGALRSFCNSEGIRNFIIPDNVGGRFSVLTPVGLLPIACAGLNIRKLISGAKRGVEKYSRQELQENISHLYAIIRNLLYTQAGKKIEVLSTFEPRLKYIIEWWKQLYGESEGKDGKGIFPAGCVFSTDLHSMGQYIQDGERILFETFLIVKNTSSIIVEEDAQNLDGLNYLKGKTLDEINFKAYEGTKNAHTDGGVPNMSIIMDKLSEENIGELIYFFEKAVAISGYLIDINPFNQPGVEAYKKNMFKLLGKPN